MEESLRFCTECGAENPTIDRPESQPTIRLNTNSYQAETTGATNYQDASRLQSQTLSAQGSAPLSTGQAPTHSNRTALIVIAAVFGVVLLLVLGGVGSRLIFSNSTAEKNLSTTQTLDTSNNQVPNTQSNIASAPRPTFTPTTTQTPNATRSESVMVTQVNASSLKREAVDTLNGWAAASSAHDLDAHMSYYADTLDTYFGRQAVSASYVRADRARAYARYYKLDVQLSNIAVTLDPSGTAATATFDKTFRFEGDKILSGSVQQMIWLTMIGGRWKITGEKDLRVYYLNK
ncbi:MAG: hypothetical protein WBP93_04075 [Pyrinomonadaceae bacterium]